MSLGTHGNAAAAQEQPQEQPQEQLEVQDIPDTPGVPVAIPGDALPVGDAAG